MKLFCLSLFLASAAFAQHNRLAPEERAVGWELLFDGATFRGWQDPRTKTPPGDSWTIEDGAIKAPEKPKLGEHLLSAQEYGDFELQWEWKTARAGNSGVRYRIQEVIFIEKEHFKPGYKRWEEVPEYEYIHRKSKRSATSMDFVVSPEYQLTDDANNGDAKRGLEYSAGALYGAIGPKRHLARPAGEWNESRIVLRGKHVTHWLNGEKVVDTDLDAPAVKSGFEKRWRDEPRIRELLLTMPKKRSPIALQNHGDAPVWFRNLKIRPLD